MSRRLGALALAALLAGCGESAQQILETAEFEEVQRAPDRARALYERLVREHPGTPEAAKAAARLEALASRPGS
jgi:hypothetical protein